MIVGEQPGDQRISPAGACRPCWKGAGPCLRGCGIARTATYVTNAVKHFKWEPRGKRRIHKKPSPRKSPLAVYTGRIADHPPEDCCSPWRYRDGRNFGSKVRVLKDRGRVFSSAMAARYLSPFIPRSSFALPTEVRPNASMTCSSAICVSLRPAAKPTMRRSATTSIRLMT